LVLSWLVLTKKKRVASQGVNYWELERTSRQRMGKAIARR
jgi:hypothetical protein